MYLIYKLANNFLCYFWNKNKSLPLLKFRKIEYFDGITFNFDFSHSTTHLGDRLFFFPLIRALYESDIPINIVDNGLSKKLFYSIYGVHLKNVRSDINLNISPKPSFFGFLNKYDNYIICDFNDLKVKNKISLELIKSFNLLLNLNLDYRIATIIKPFESHQFLPIIKNEKYIIFNNYINSGFFRLFFISTMPLIKRCKHLKKQGFKVIHIGSANDKKSDLQKYDFIDIDLRGKLSMNALIELISSDYLSEVITFDNFIMHLSHIYTKPTSVLFRGRFLGKNKNHHIQYINNTFLNKDKRINYL
jgi:hypothetical protein